ncbi:MAG: PorT family protein [Bacteroidales bacterium]|nr:PorT family protein [Bacteroidales bacterium]
MKKVLAVLMVLLMVLPLFSQVKFGIKAGASTTNLRMEDLMTLTSGTTQYTVEALKGANYGFHAGAFLRLGMMGVYFQPELLFTSRTDEYTVTDLDNPAVSIIEKQKFNQLDLPLMLGAKIGPVRLNAGPSARLLLNSPKDLIDHPDFKSMYNNLTFGYQAGLGFDIAKKLTVDLRYEGSLQKYQTQIENATGEKFKLDDRPNAFLLSVGFMF